MLVVGVVGVADATIQPRNTPAASEGGCKQKKVKGCGTERRLLNNKGTTSGTGGGPGNKIKRACGTGRKPKLKKASVAPGEGGGAAKQQNANWPLGHLVTWALAHLTTLSIGESWMISKLS